MTNSIKTILGLLVLAALIAFFVFGLKPNANETKINTSSVTENESTNAANKSASEASNNSGNASSSIADEWVWPEGEGVKVLSAEDMRELQFGEKSYSLHSIYAALESVRVDENGNLILDNLALDALNEALERYYKNIDTQALREIEEIIKDALPGKLGEQTAQLVRDYHGFLGAQDEFNQIHQYVEGPQNVSEVERDRNLYSELQALREVHLGSEVSDRLFAQNDSGARFMFDMMSIDMDTSLTPEERAIRQAAVQERFEQEQSGQDQSDQDVEEDSGNSGG